MVTDTDDAGLAPSPDNPIRSTESAGQQKQQQQQPISIAQAAARIAQTQKAAHEAKLAALQAFCSAFDDVAQQHGHGHARDFCQTVARQVLGLLETALSGQERQPPPHQQNTPSYAQILKRGTQQHKEGAHATRQQARQPQPTTTPIPTPTPEDLRVFVRLHQDSPAWQYAGYAIRYHAAEATGLTIQSFPTATRVKTGWAVRAADVAAKEALLQNQSEISGALRATAVEAFEKWHTYIIDGCPRHFYNAPGLEETDYLAVITHEVITQARQKPITQARQKPISVRPTKNDDTTKPTTTIVVAFEKPVNHRWRLFGTSRMARAGAAMQQLLGFSRPLGLYESNPLCQLRQERS
ncbi:hypothetical protein HIM_11513 [Hirsutella minnesotensis 3608]|uniref:Uncharacterized protein n=1 Tax=Hirsutella minnesotensis 3608 TaxID=1043627 RepID=A0A0F7ZFG6_9HYPO|nr:hypothetical protein HIM_11513 [Hirsutella minnesotensis 3608]